MVFLFLSCRETHAENRPPAAGVHVPQLHVAENEGGWSADQVGDRLCSSEIDNQLL